MLEWTQYEPKEVFSYFEALTKIPRGSGNEKEVCNYIEHFAKQHHLSYDREPCHNIVIRKSAAKGYEDEPGVMLQAHLDMVNEKTITKVHDFLKDPLSVKVVEGFLYAEETTLGADNGIGVAMILAILAAQDLKAPAIEAIFTTEEEVGLGGAKNLETSKLLGRYLINLDAEEEGCFYVSCAGGATVKFQKDFRLKALPYGLKTCQIRFEGLKGGHSGLEIDKGRANGVKLIGRYLYFLGHHISHRLVDISAGTMFNAIPNQAQVTLAYLPEDEDKLRQMSNDFLAMLKQEYHLKENDLKIFIEKNGERPTHSLDENSEKTLVSMLMALKEGVHTMSVSIGGLVESSFNPAIIKVDGRKLSVVVSIRSSVDSIKTWMLEEMDVLARAFGFEIEISSVYPGWAYDPDSKLRTHMSLLYQSIFGEKPQIVAVHGGLECGILKEKLPHVDMISIGPNLLDVHTPKEHVEIDSVRRVYEFLKMVLEKMKVCE